MNEAHVYISTAHCGDNKEEVYLHRENGDTIFIHTNYLDCGVVKQVSVKLKSNYYLESLSTDNPTHNILLSSIERHASRAGIINYIPIIVRKNSYTEVAGIIDLDKGEIVSLDGNMINDSVEAAVCNNPLNKFVEMDTYAMVQGKTY